MLTKRQGAKDVVIQMIRQNIDSTPFRFLNGIRECVTSGKVLMSNNNDRSKTPKCLIKKEKQKKQFS